MTVKVVVSETVYVSVEVLNKPDDSSDVIEETNVEDENEDKLNSDDSKLDELDELDEAKLLDSKEEDPVDVVEPYDETKLDSVVELNFKEDSIDEDGLALYVVDDKEGPTLDAVEDGENTDGCGWVENKLEEEAEDSTKDTVDDTEDDSMDDGLMKLDPVDDPVVNSIDEEDSISDEVETSVEGKVDSKVEVVLVDDSTEEVKLDASADDDSVNEGKIEDSNSEEETSDK